MRIKEVTPKYIHMGIQFAEDRKLKRFSPEWEKFLAEFLNGLVETETVTTTVDIWK